MCAIIVSMVMLHTKEIVKDTMEMVIVHTKEIAKDIMENVREIAGEITGTIMTDFKTRKYLCLDPDNIQVRLY